MALPSHPVKPYVGSSIRHIGYPHRGIALYDLFYSYIKIDKPSDDDEPTTHSSHQPKVCPGMYPAYRP